MSHFFTFVLYKGTQILPDLVPFSIRVNKFMEINQMWVISKDVYQTWLISNFITILPDLDQHISNFFTWCISPRFGPFRVFEIMNHDSNEVQ